MSATDIPLLYFTAIPRHIHLLSPPSGETTPCSWLCTDTAPAVVAPQSAPGTPSHIPTKNHTEDSSGRLISHSTRSPAVRTPLNGLRGRGQEPPSIQGKTSSSLARSQTVFLVHAHYKLMFPGGMKFKKSKVPSGTFRIFFWGGKRNKLNIFCSSLTSIFLFLALLRAGHQLWRRALQHAVVVKQRDLESP